jgi:hypothetical protein
MPETTENSTKQDAQAASARKLMWHLYTRQALGILLAIAAGLLFWHLMGKTLDKLSPDKIPTAQVEVQEIREPYAGTPQDDERIKTTVITTTTSELPKTSALVALLAAQVVALGFMLRFAMGLLRDD